MAAPLDFFIHIPKTAGTTLTRIIEAQYPRGTAFIFQEADYAAREERIAKLAPAVRIVSAHLHSGWAEKMERPCRMFTVLRDPTERIISLYFYIAREPLHPWHQNFLRGEIGIEKLAREQGAHQARIMAGYLQTAEVPAERLLAEAKERLENGMAAFGLTERFDETMLLFNQAFGWKVRSYTPTNITRNRPKQSQLEPADIAAIRAHNTVDQALYDFASRLFAERIAAQPPDFAKRLAALRTRTKIARSVAGLRQRIARLVRARQ